MRFAAANVRELIFLKIAIEQKAVEYGLKGRIVVANLLTSVNSLNKKIIKNLLPGAVEHPATLISRQESSVSRVFKL